MAAPRLAKLKSGETMPDHRHKPTAETRARVVELAAGGASIEAIAYDLRITPKAVRDLYGKELTIGPELRANLRRLAQGEGVAAAHAARALARLESEDGEDDFDPPGFVDDGGEPMPPILILPNNHRGVEPREGEPTNDPRILAAVADYNARQASWKAERAKLSPLPAAPPPAALPAPDGDVVDLPAVRLPSRRDALTGKFGAGAIKPLT